MLSDEVKAKLKSLFNSWNTLMDEKAELTKQMNDYLKEAEVASEIKKTKIRKAFAYLRKLAEDGNNELQEVNDIFVEMRN